MNRDGVSLGRLKTLEKLLGIAFFPKMSAHFTKHFAHLAWIAWMSVDR